MKWQHYSYVNCVIRIWITHRHRRRRELSCGCRVERIEPKNNLGIEEKMHVEFTYGTYSRRYQFVVIIIVTHFRHAFSPNPRARCHIVSHIAPKPLIFITFSVFSMLGARDEHVVALNVAQSVYHLLVNHPFANHMMPHVEWVYFVDRTKNEFWNMTTTVNATGEHVHWRWWCSCMVERRQNGAVDSGESRKPNDATTNDAED